LAVGFWRSVEAWGGGVQTDDNDALDLPEKTRAATRSTETIALLW